MVYLFVRPHSWTGHASAESIDQLVSEAVYSRKKRYRERASENKLFAEMIMSTSSIFSDGWEHQRRGRIRYEQFLFRRMFSIIKKNDDLQPDSRCVVDYWYAFSMLRSSVHMSIPMCDGLIRVGCSTKMFWLAIPALRSSGGIKSLATLLFLLLRAWFMLIDRPVQVRIYLQCTHASPVLVVPFCVVCCWLYAFCPLWHYSRLCMACVLVSSAVQKMLGALISLCESLKLQLVLRPGPPSPLPRQNKGGP